MEAVRLSETIAGLHDVTSHNMMFLRFTTGTHSINLSVECNSVYNMLNFVYVIRK
jgi:hypothetical protein